MNKKLDEAVATMKSFIETYAKAGFDSEDEIVCASLEYMDGEAEPSFLLPHAKKIARKAFKQLREEQPTWPDVTDCDRLDAAFAELDANGIISRQNFSCCQNCGSYEIGEQMQDAIDSGREVRGYTFYHEQDTESGVEGYGVCLAYGSIEESEEAHIAMAHEIVSTIEKHGLHPVWNGELNKRIEVPLDWKRRREFPPEPTLFGKLRTLF